MFRRATGEHRVLGFDVGDWFLLSGGLALAGLLAMLV
jgi:hypothetical protein